MYVIHQAIIEEALAIVVRDPEAIGLLLTGSLARGDAHPGSDVDLRVLLASERVRAFRSEFHRGIVVEQAYADVALAEAHLENNPMEVYAYLDGRILHDPTGDLARLAEAARQRFSTYHAPPEERAAIAYWLRSARLKMAAAGAAGDLRRAAYVSSTTSWPLLTGLWAANDRPMPPSGAVWAHLADLSKGPLQVEARLECLFMGEASERVQVAIDLIEWAVPHLETVT